MRASFVFTIVALFLVGCVVADTDVCETTTADLKSATRTLNAWRAACEDNNWKGSTCYNYWAQLNEVMDLENNLQTCLTRVFQQRQAYMLGSSTQTGAFTADGTDSRGEENTNNDATSTLAVKQATSTRTHVTTTIDGVIADTLSTLNTETTSTRAKVTSEYDATRDFESKAHGDIRGLENTSAKNILNTIKTQETQNRKTVADDHNTTRSQITAVDVADGVAARTDNNKQEASTRATMVVEATETQGVHNSQSAQTQAFDLAQERQTRELVGTEEQRSRTSASAAHAQTKVELDAATAAEQAEVDAQTEAIKAVLRTDAAANDAAVAAAASQSRDAFSGLQALLVSSYQLESDAMNTMFATLFKILIHFDLQGKWEKWSETFTFATISNLGLGRFEQLRSETLTTLTNNESMYGTDKVGYARWYWNEGEKYYRNNNYRAAAEQYRLSYAHATVSRS